MAIEQFPQPLVLRQETPKRDSECRQNASPPPPAQIKPRAPADAVAVRLRLSPQLPSASPENEPENHQEQQRTHSGADDGRDNSGTKMDAQTRQQPASNESADDADCDVGNQAKSSPLHDLPRQPSGDETD